MPLLQMRADNNGIVEGVGGPGRNVEGGALGNGGGMGEQTNTLSLVWLIGI